MAVAPPIFPGAAPATIATLSRSPLIVFSSSRQGLVVRLNSRLLNGPHETGVVVEGPGRRFEVVPAQSLIELVSCEPQSLGRLRLVATDLVQYARDRAPLYSVEIDFGLVELRTAM